MPPTRRGELSQGRPAWGKHKPSRRRPYGAYSALGLRPPVSARQIARARDELVVSVEKGKPASQQEQSAKTKRLREISSAAALLLRSKAAYDRSIGVNPSTLRVQRFRRKLSRKESKIVTAIDTARNVLQRQRARTRPQTQVAVADDREVVVRKNVTSRSKVAAPNTSWSVCKRTRGERRKDGRKGRFLAVNEKKVVMPK